MNQAFFMGFFFLIAGSLTPRSYDRHGPTVFLRERLIRLGLPILAYGLMLGPITIAIANARTPAGFAAILLRPRFDIGPLWFAEALLLFALAYAACRALPPPTAPGPRRSPHAVLLLAAIAVGAAAFAIRLAIPVGETRLGLQLAYFASYVALFVVGIRNPALAVAFPIALPWLGLSLLSLLLLTAYAARPGLHSFSGGWSLDAAVYAFWEPFFAWGVILTLLALFHRYANTPSAVFGWLSRRAFASYIIHPPLLVAIARTLHPWAAAPWAKTLLAGTLTCLACLLVSNMLLLVPPIQRVV